MNHVRASSVVLAIALMGHGVATAATLQVIDGCALPPVKPSGSTYYIDPVAGSAAGNGSLAKPWKSLQAINGTAAYSNPAWQLPGCKGANTANCKNGPLLSTQLYSHLDPVSKKTVRSVNPNAPIKPGDTILLKNGNYGDVSLNGISNPSFITIAAAPGQTPVLGSLQLIGSAKWIIQGLTFRSLADGYSPFVDISGGRGYSAGHDIILDHNDFASQDNVSAWTRANWVTRGRFSAIQADGGDQSSTYEKCVAITNNTIKNVRWGMGVLSDKTLIDGNTIDNYGDDAIDFAANDLVISHNRITNSRNIGDGNHADAMQGQLGYGIGGKTVYDNILIDGNVVIDKTIRNLQFPGDLQGISAFDMDWSNLTVINNVVITNAYHGIAFYSVHGGLIANNTVLATGKIGTWLGVFDRSHQGARTNNVVVRNNIVSNMDSDSTAATLTFDHNLVGTQIAWQMKGKPQWLNQSGTYGSQNVIDPKGLTSIFKKFNVAQLSYDVHLMAGSLAVGTGNASAPPDMSGKPRKAPVDLGVYVHQP